MYTQWDVKLNGTSIVQYVKSVDIQHDIDSYTLSASVALADTSPRIS